MCLALAWLALACSPTPAPDEDGRRLVSLSPSISSVLVALGAAEEIVGIDRYSAEIPALRHRPSLGGLFAPDLERLVELRPTLVLGVRGVHQQVFFELLRARGLHCVEIDSSGTLDGVLETYAQVGDLVDRAEEARALIEHVRSELDALRASVAGRRRPRVALILDVEPLYVAGRGGFVNDLIRAAGGENVFVDLDESYPRVSLEVLAERAPDVLLDSSLEPGDPDTLARARARWRRFAWVRRVEFLPRGLATLPGAELARGARLIRARLHPELAAGATP